VKNQAKAQAVENTQGVRPAMQARSLKKRHDLLKAGRKLLHTRVLEEISIKDICSEASCTVGSFYSRFEDKESYFDALIAESCQELLMSAASQFDDRNWVGVGGQQICDEVVSFLVSIFQGEYSAHRQHCSPRPLACLGVCHPGGVRSPSQRPLARLGPCQISHSRIRNANSECGKQIPRNQVLTSPVVKLLLNCEY